MEPEPCDPKPFVVELSLSESPWFSGTFVVISSTDTVAFSLSQQSISDFESKMFCWRQHQ